MNYSGGEKYAKCVGKDKMIIGLLIMWIGK